MKLTICKIIAYLLLITFCSCSHETENPIDLNLTIKLLGNPVCNHLKSAGIIGSTSNSQSCVEYSYDQVAKKLSLKHNNAGFNCCPESLFCKVTFRNDTIVIQEFEKSMGCKCNCLYDLDMEVNGLETDKYQLRIIELYVGNQNKLNFELDLPKQNQGTQCVTRWQYPWGN